MSAAERSVPARAEKREAFPPGTLVGERYRIVSALARGGFGTIYVAEQLATTRRVALKLLTSHASDVTIERLLAEARIASRVNSEHIVQVYDAGIDSESSLVFVAMELLSGLNLAELVRKHGPRSADETAEYLRQVALGLDKVHGVVTSDGRPAPIVHRDLKPANLFLTRREDGTAWIKILDFGAAKMLSDDAHPSAVIRGTPEFMAYEQAAGAEITRATDIWPLGLIAFSLLTGRSYWRGAKTESDRAQVFGEVLTLPLVPASERAREVGAAVALGVAFDAWFFRCVNRDATERYASAGEAARELARALDLTVRPVAVPWLDETTSEGDAPSVKASHPSTREPSGVAASSRAAPRSRLNATAVAVVVFSAVALLLGWLRTSKPEAGDTARAGTSSNSLPPAPSGAPSSQLLVPLPTNNAASAAPARLSALPPASATQSPSAAQSPSATHHRGAPRSAASAASSSATGVPRREDPYDLR